MKCPICKKEVKPGSEHFPFCGDRCRLIDLGNWAEGKYVIPAEPVSLEDLEDDESEPAH